MEQHRIRHFLKALGKPGKSLYYNLRRRHLRNRSVTIISNNCWAGFIYKRYRLPFNSPFIGLFIMADDYLRILENPEVLADTLTFISLSDSKWLSQIKPEKDYPVGVIGGDIEIHFLHYADAGEARSKWNKRVRRIDWSNAIVKFSDNTGATPGLLERFDRLPFAQKVCFAARPYEGLDSVVALPEQSGRPEVKSCWTDSDFSWDFVDHANALLK